MNTDQFIADAKVEFAKSIEFLKDEFSKLQTGRASAVLVENLQVEAYGTNQPLKATGQISIPESRTIQIRPWDKGLLKNIETAIRNSGMSLNPINNGDMIMINLPQLTEERRKELSKLVHKMAEESRISIRQARQKALQKFKELGISDDEVVASEKKLQVQVDEVNKLVDELAKKKEVEVMTV